MARSIVAMVRSKPWNALTQSSTRPVSGGSTPRDLEEPAANAASTGSALSQEAVATVAGSSLRSPSLVIAASGRAVCPSRLCESTRPPTTALVVFSLRSTTSKTLSMDVSIWITADRSARVVAALISMLVSTCCGNGERNVSNTSRSQAVSATSCIARYCGRPVLRSRRFRSASSVTNGANMPTPCRSFSSACFRQTAHRAAPSPSASFGASTKSRNALAASSSRPRPFIRGSSTVMSVATSARPLHKS